MLRIIIGCMIVGSLCGACAKDAPDLNYCMAYLEEHGTCEADGCLAMSAAKTVFVGDRCVAMKEFGCMPLENQSSCESVDEMFCSDTGAVTEVVYTGNSCDYNVGDGWSACSGYHMNCQPDPELCELLTDETACLSNYCVWIGSAQEAILSGNTCLGWEVSDVQLCTGNFRYQELIYRYRGEGVQLLKIKDVTIAPGISYMGYDETWLPCDGTAADPAFCACD